MYLHAGAAVDEFFGIYISDVEKLKLQNSTLKYYKRETYAHAAFVNKRELGQTVWQYIESRKIYIVFSDINARKSSFEKHVSKIW